MNLSVIGLSRLTVDLWWHGVRIFWGVLGTSIGASVIAATTAYPIPSFTEQVLVPASTTMVWVPPTTQNVWVPATTIQVWLPPVTHTELVPDATTTIVHPAVTTTVNHPAVTTTIDHPAVYDVIHHDIEIGVTHHDEQGHMVVHPASTHTEYVAGYWNEYSVEGYWDWAWIEGYWNWEVVDYEGNQEGWVWYEGHSELVWMDGFTDYDWVEGYSYEVTDTEAWDEWVVDVAAYDEYYIISPAYNEYVEIAAAWTQTITVQEAWTETIVQQPSRTEIVVLTWKTVTIVDQEGRFVNQEVPGYWNPQTVPGWWDSVTIPAYYRTDTIPASTLTVENNGQDIVGATWSTGRTVSVPAWIHDFLNNPNWSLDEPDDDEDSAVFTMAYAFQSVQTAQRMPLPNSPRRIGKPNGKWGTVETATAGPMTAEEAGALITIQIVIAAQELTKTRVNPSEIMAYITYEKLSKDLTPPRKVYTGRTSGWGPSEKVTERRDAKHLITRPDFHPAIPNTIIVTLGWSDAAWAATRGREQSIMDYHDMHNQSQFSYSYSLSHSENARPSLGRPNGTRGVARDNIRGFDYHAVSIAAFGTVWDFTGYNRVHYEPYFWPPSNLLLPPFFRPPLTY